MCSGDEYDFSISDAENGKARLSIRFKDGSEMVGVCLTVRDLGLLMGEITLARWVRHAAERYVER